MPRDKDDPPAVRVYTVCDESRYLIVRNVPALGCTDELSKLFGSYGEVQECKPMDAEVCEPFTDVYWIRFSQVNNARFAKRKLDDFVFLGNQLQVSYAPEFESLSDTKEKLEGRRKEVISRIRFGQPEASKGQLSNHIRNKDSSQQHWHREYGKPRYIPDVEDPLRSHVSSNKEYFSSPSMNATVELVRKKLDNIQSSSSETKPASKKARVENRRRI